MFLLLIFTFWIFIMIVTASSERCGSSARPMSYEEIDARSNKIRNMLKGIKMPEGKKVRKAFYSAGWKDYNVYIEWEENGITVEKAISGNSIRDLEYNLKEQIKLWL